ncbi:twin-arginine translocation pathway [Mycolicibacter heraklionensis]|nr:twin-arginine translocation pathway [Mycolicibacter heraklionensis]
MTRSASRRDMLRYAALLGPALALPGALGATAGTPRAGANGLQVIDFAHRLVPPEQIKAAGFDGALVYVSELRPGATFDFKPVTREYADGLRAVGLQVASCYQFGKPGWTQSPSDFTRGFDGGVADAQTALRLHTAAGGRRAPIFFSVDEDIDRNTWNTVALPWFRGINSVLGVQRTGVYGGINVCQWAAADGVIGVSRTPGKRWAWQTRSWSRGQIDPAAVLYQRIVSTASTPGPIVGGIEVDVNDVLAQDCGQWNLHP